MKVVLTVLAATFAVAGCGKAQEAVSEKAAEKMIESAVGKDGASAKVDLGGGGGKVTMEGADGKTSQIEGSANLTEADAGLKFYPGSKVADGGGMRTATEDTTGVVVRMTTADAPDKVAAFFRDQLKAAAEGKQLMDASDGSGGTMLSLADAANKSSVAVNVTKVEGGSEIAILTSRPRPK
jgi:hypothetical protein